jgi:hypothetical protein
MKFSSRSALTHTSYGTVGLLAFEQFVIMSSSQQPQPAAAAATPPAKQRDKFAALAAAAAAAAAAGNTTTPTSATNGAATSVNRVNTEHPRRDKFAAVQQLKISDNRQQQAERLRHRCLQRDAVWNDIDTAEAHVTKLLHLASQTALALSQQAAGSNSSNSATSTSSIIDLRETQRQYRETIQEIHRLLSPHADLVQAYRAPSHVNEMYLERVEQRIAESKLELLQELLHQSGVVVVSAATSTTTTSASGDGHDNSGGGANETVVVVGESETNKKRKADEY